MKILNKLILTTLSGLLMTPSIFGQAVEADQSQVDFGLVVFGETASEEVTLTNLLSVDIDVVGITYFEVYGSNPFEVEGMPSSIPANGTATFNVVYSPVHNIVHNTELVIKTTGNRGAISIDLIGDCMYDNAYYNASHDLIDEDLEAALKTIISAGYDEHSYSGARDEMYMFVDNKRVNGQGASQNTLTRSYLGTDAVGYTSRSDAQGSPYNLNTEHTFPQGHFNQDLPMRSDLHHLFVTDIDANSTRGNFAFGNVVNSDWTEGGSSRGTNEGGTTVFEPRDAQKGLTSRAVLYFVLRYQNYGGFLTANQEEVLREWSAEFPPIAAEVTRNDDVQAYQNNRNPLTDYPQFLDRIYSIRLEEDRPNVAVMNISDNAIDFLQLESNVSATYSLVITNSGERFISISNVNIIGNDSGVYSLPSSLPSSISINPGESFAFEVTALTANDGDDLLADLSFTTNVPGQQDVSVPIMSSVHVGVFDLAYENEDVLAPNPFDQSLRLISSNTSYDYITMYDMTGRMCLNQDLSNNTIVVAELPSGFYLAHLVKADGTVVIQKLIKQ